ncbi:hypothetical protein V5O48_010685 [Marasmius crinis-equi]|uniref:Uncharacterized protein n=1 Tax=Marasmius crinis-equi TaxID=585013 RepID=A0ABR3F7Z7_9AGAR
MEVSKDHLPTLAASSLVNAELREMAASVLYSRLHLRVGEYMGPGRRPRRGLNPIPRRGQVGLALTSASLPHNRNRVRTLVLEGTCWEDSFSEKVLLDALRQFQRLERLSFNLQCPRWDYVEGSDRLDSTTVVEAISIINNQNRVSLRELTLNFVVEQLEDDSLVILLQNNLIKLSLLDVPGYVLLETTPLKTLECLTELQVRINPYNFKQNKPSSFTEVFGVISNNCHNLKSLTLGVIRADLNEELFDSVARLHCLEELCLEYSFRVGYHDGFSPREPLTTDFPPLRTLKVFTLRYKSIRELNLDVPVVCKWIKHVISLSPIERVNFRPFYQPRTCHPIPKCSWDILTDHLADKHADTLRSFDLRAGFVRKTAMKAVLSKCRRLEEFEVATGEGSLMLLPRFSSNLPNLSKARFEFRTMKGTRHALQLDSAKAAEIMEASGHLRRLIVNDDEWKGSWVLEGGVLKYLVTSQSSNDERRKGDEERSPLPISHFSTQDPWTSFEDPWVQGADAEW